MPDVLVIGAGVVGLSAAIAAQARGLSVTVVDREGPAAGASAGNAGAFAFTDILPLASPGIMRKAPGWLLDPLGPLSVPPRHALRIAPWMVRFAAACRPGRVAASVAAQTALMDLSRDELEPFLRQTGTHAMLRKDGNLQVYETEAEFAAAAPGWAARTAHGIAFRHMERDEMAELQPGLSPRFLRGTFTPGWYSIADPKLYTLALADHLRAQGGEIVTAEITALRPTDSGVEATAADGRVLTAGQAVVAAGAFSHRLARSLGERIPLETERGYNTTLPPDALDLPPNFARSRAMLDKAKAFLPALRTEGGTQWMGFRPSLPDSLPAIGHARASRRVVYAFGHGHLGLTQSAGTARLVADLLTGAAPAIELSRFSPQRF